MNATRYNHERLRDYGFSSGQEWLETNGLGGYASATVSGANTRRYHGVLVAAMHPPVGRQVVLSKLDETVVAGSNRHELSVNQYPGNIHPKGFQLLQFFERGLFPEFTYQAGRIVIKKTVAAVHGENTTIILYEVVQAPTKFRLELLPLCSSRDYHSLCVTNDALYKGYVMEGSVFQTKNYKDGPELFISVPGAQFEPTQTWYNNVEYAGEQERGLDFREDLFNHGRFVAELENGKKLGVIISTEDPKGKEAFELFAKEKDRRESLVKPYGAGPAGRLVFAADQFVVKRGRELKTVIAGYHWFSDWGRDTMIALPGLCLVTRRFEDARKILKAFSESVSEGMLPNRFPDQGEMPEYNTVDATLWFFHAIYQYFKYTGDLEFIKALLPVLSDIMDWHYKGTRYNIHVAQDELLYAGTEGVQLTWMDAKVGDWVVTPRKGKTVEINALWFNALSAMATLLQSAGQDSEADRYKERARKVQANFGKVFWNAAKGCLFDYADGDYRNDDLRPNQIYALSLPFKLLDGGKAKQVFDIVTSQLLTPRGLRSLSKDHKDYKAHYVGDPWHRDGAYHQGTVWSFLLGPYIDALMHLQGAVAKRQATLILEGFLEHLDEAGVGTISEIFDADAPYYPRGCIAQAWGVAEILRVAVEHQLVQKDPRPGI